MPVVAHLAAVKIAGGRPREAAFVGELVRQGLLREDGISFALAKCF